MIQILNLVNYRAMFLIKAIMSIKSNKKMVKIFLMVLLNKIKEFNTSLLPKDKKAKQINLQKLIKELIHQV